MAYLSFQLKSFVIVDFKSCDYEFKFPKWKANNQAGICFCKLYCFWKAEEANGNFL